MLKAFFGSKRGFLRYLRYLIADRALFKYRRYYSVTGSVDRVVFVCKGNVCRSPFAERVFNTVSLLPTASFGLDTTTGCSAHPPIVKIAYDMGFDLSCHLTTSVNDFVKCKNDLFVCTEPSHVEGLIQLFPNVNVVLIGGFLKRRNAYIHDPYNTSNEYRKRCLHHLVDSTLNLAIAIRRANQE